MHVRRRRPFLVVVEQDVVRRVRRRKTVDVAVLQLHLPLEVRSERLEVGCGLRPVPGRDPDAGGVGHLRRELGGDAARALPFATRNANERRVVLVPDSVERLEQPADLVGHESLVHQTRQGRGCLGPRVCACSRHRDAGVPIQQGLCVTQIGELRENCLEAVEWWRVDGNAHGPTSGR